MANDRVHIRCSGCGGWKMLLKHMGRGLYTGDNGILEWLDSHGKCHPQAFGADLGGDPGFTLHTENTDLGTVLSMDRQNALPPD